MSMPLFASAVRRPTLSAPPTTFDNATGAGR
jgi:hypothetical protein